ncbi:MAG: ABC transporter permease, partial [bacterium]
MAGSTPASATANASPRPLTSPWSEAWRRFRKHKLAVISAVLLG